MPLVRSWPRPGRRWWLGVLCALVAFALAGVGLGDEGFVSLQGDMPRYLMNGVFLHDVLRDRPFGSLDTFVEYARLYYARYPALSLGHHPVLVSIADVPAFAIFGVSVLAGRLPVVASLVAAVVYLYRLLTELYDEWVGLVAALVLATVPPLLVLSQSVMSEPPAIALLVIAAYYLHRFCVTGRRGALALFVLAAGCSVWAKQLTVVAFPAFLTYAVARLGWRRLLQRDTILAALALVLLVGPVVPFSLAMSPTNARVITQGAGNAAAPEDASLQLRLVLELARSVAWQVSAPVGILGAFGLAAMAWRRRLDAWLFLPWIAGNAALVVLATRFIDMPRFTLYWVPAWAAAAGVACGPGRWQAARVVLAVLMIVPQGVAIARHPLPGAGGYETAARYVVEHPHGASVLFSGDVDTGYFVFFVRKHDEARRLVVLRSDKILTTSAMSRVAVEDRISDPSQIAPRLAELGVGYVVIEDRRSQSQVLEWLHEALRTGPYEERLRVPIATSDARLQGTDLVVYRVNGAAAPAPNARLDMRLPIVSREVDVAMSDLLDRKYLR